MASPTLAILSGLNIPEITTEITLQRTKEPYSLVAEDELDLSALPVPTIDDGEGGRIDIAGSYRVSVVPVVVPTGWKQTSTKVRFFPQSADFPSYEAVLFINVSWT